MPVLSPTAVSALLWRLTSSTLDKDTVKEGGLLTPALLRFIWEEDAIVKRALAYAP